MKGGIGEGAGEIAHGSSEVSDEDLAQEQPFDGAEGDAPLFPETKVWRKFKAAPQEGEEKGASLPETIVCSTSERSAKRKSAESKHFHYRNPPMWTTPTGLILIGWRMRCPICYHQDGHSAMCSEQHELPVIFWIQPMFIHGIVHYMTYADGEWWHDRDPKP